jgi:hypothetical protein
MAEGDRTVFYRDEAGEHRWKIVAANHEIVDASSEGFVTEGSARRNYERAGHDLVDAPEKLEADV